MSRENEIEPLTVISYLKKCIAASGLPIKEIERKVGARHKLRLQPILDGNAKLEFMMVHRLAHVFGIDAEMLLRLYVHDYFPESEAAVFDAGELTVLTKNERALVDAYRRQAGAEDLELLVFDGPRFVMVVVKDKPA